MDIVEIANMRIGEQDLLMLPTLSKASCPPASSSTTGPSPSPLSAANIDIAPLESTASSSIIMMPDEELVVASSSSSSEASDTASNIGDAFTFSSSSLSSPGPSTPPPFASSKAPSELDIAATDHHHNLIHHHNHQLALPQELSKSLSNDSNSNSSSSNSSIASTSKYVSSTRASTSKLPPTVSRTQMRKYAADIVRKEAKALLDLAARLDAPSYEEEDEVEGDIPCDIPAPQHRLKGPTSQDAFSRTVEIIRRMSGHGRIIMTGVGKSGLLARKAVATFNSFGIPSGFLHPVEALHGDLGLLSPYGVDTVILISYSGRTRELLELLHHLRQRRVYACISLSCPESALAEACDVNIDVSLEDDHEAEESVPAPTSSVVTALAALDALALTLLRLNTGWESHTSERRKAFGLHHPGGSLGQQLSSTRGP